MRTKGNHGSCRHRARRGCRNPHEVEEAQGRPRGAGQAARALGGGRRPRGRHQPRCDRRGPRAPAGGAACGGRHRRGGAARAPRHGRRRGRVRRSARRLRRLARGSLGRLPAHHRRHHPPARGHARAGRRGRGGAHHGAGEPLRLRAHRARPRGRRGAHRGAEGREQRRGRHLRVQLRLLLLRRPRAVRRARPGGRRQRPGRVLPHRRAGHLPRRRPPRAGAPTIRPSAWA